MKPKERILSALKRQETDYLPCVPKFWSSPKVSGYQWKDESERLEVLINRLGVDTYLSVGLERPHHPDVKEKVWEEKPSNEKYPVLHKIFETPKGNLEAVVRKTEDWPHGQDIPLLGDFNVSRYIKPWLETAEDVEKFAYLRLPPGKEENERFREQLKNWQKLIERYQVPTYATYAMGLTSGLHLFGAQQMVMLSMDNPEIITRFLEIQHQTDIKVLKILLDSGVDIVRRNGWYESTDFWSPSQFERWVLPQLKKEVEITHQATRPLIYTMCTGIMPLLPFLSKIEFDSLDTIEPVLGNQDMDLIVKELGDKKSLWGGVSAPIHIGRGKPGDVRDAVDKAVSIFGRKGFILTAAPSIRPQWPWENVMAMIDEWKKIR